MTAARRWWKRLTSWTRRGQDEARLQAEIEDHLARQSEDHRRAGLSETEARRQAVLKFGAVEAMKEEYRDQKGLPFFETLIRDTRMAVRRLRKAPAFTLTTVVTVALGIGATTSIFTLVHAVLLRSLAVENPNDLYRLGRDIHCCLWGGYTQGGGFSVVSYELYQHFRDNTKGFAELAGSQAGGSSLMGVRRANEAGAAQSRPTEFVSGNYFKMFGVHALAGRPLLESDDHADAAPVAVMSYRLWQQQYGADPNVIGSVFYLNNKAVTVVGVAPPSFFGDTLSDSPPDFFLPLATEPMIRGDGSVLKTARAHWLHLIGRLRPGATAASVEAQMRVELQQWLRSHWDEMDANARAALPQQTVYLSPGGAGITSMRVQYEQWLKVLMMAAGFVLLIVCANVANLMLVRGIEQRQQTSLSVALGAKPARLVRQAFTESVLLSLVGGAAGLAIAFAGTRLILHYAFARFDGVATVPISPAPSMPVLLFAFAISFATGIVFGIAPAWMAARVDPIDALRGVNRSTSRQWSLPRKLLVICQAALCLVLLTTSGLLTAALGSLEHQDFGFDSKGRTVVSIDPDMAGYKPEQLSVLYEKIADSLSQVPGVASAALCAYSPQSGESWTDGVFINGRPVPGPNEDNSSSFTRVTAGFFEAIGNPILRGRAITRQDTNESQHVAVVNEAFVKRFFPHENPIGKHFGRSEASGSRMYEIVGVAKDVRYLTYNLRLPVTPFFYLPEPQHDTFATADFTKGDRGTHFFGDLVVAMRPGATISDAAVRHAIATVDPNLPVIWVRTLEEQVASQFNQQRLIARLTAGFGMLSVVLACIGLYGVTAYNAGRRTNEIGVRMALGAERHHVVALVLRGAFGSVLVGLALGLPLTFAAGRYMGSQLYNLKPFDPWITGLSVIALSIAALIASFIPAARASLVSPLNALRNE